MQFIILSLVSFCKILIRLVNYKSLTTNLQHKQLTFVPLLQRFVAMTLHIVSFDIPYPANYGGVIVIFNQIKALHALGVKVILHCFQYGDRTPQPELAQYCQEVYYYKMRLSNTHC